MPPTGAACPEADLDRGTLAGWNRPAMRKRPPKPPPPPTLVDLHIRLFAEDVAALKLRATERGVPWHVELRLLVRDALRGTRREVVVLKENPDV